MFDAESLDAYIQRRQLSAVAARVIRGVRDTEPSRRVRGGKANVACRFASRKMGRVIQAESHKNELAAVVGWEHDEETYEFYDQPPRIKLTYAVPGRRRVTCLTTPDYFLLQERFTGWVECKTEDWLKAQSQDGSVLYVPDGAGGWRCPPGEEYAAALGLEFRVRSSAESNWVWLRNLEFLSDYLDERCPAPAFDEVERIRAACFEGRAWLFLKDLLGAGFAVSADVLYKLIADRHLYIDLEKELLAEPERTRVYRDRCAADAYRIHVASQCLPTVTNFQTLGLSAGQQLLWDGQPWRILNVGDDEVFLEGINRELATLRRAVIQELVREGTITGLPQSAQSEPTVAEAIVRSAGPADFEHALHRYYCLFPEKAPKNAPQASERALRKWRALYRQGQQALGSGFVGLLPKIQARGNRERKLDEAVIAVMDAVIDELFAVPSQRTLVTCWGEVSNRCEVRGLMPPSEQAFRDQLRRRRAHDLKAAREGDKAAYALEEFYWCLERTTPRHGERPFEIGHIDHTELDLQFVGSRRGEKLGRAWLTLFIDAFTRMILAWVVMFEEPSYRSCMMVIRECVRRHGRIPKYIVVDRGSEFEGEYFETLLACFESHKKTRPGSKPRFGSVIERLFGISNREFVHNLEGNNQALQKPRSLSKGYDPRRRAIWTLPEFTAAFEGYLERVYFAREHQALSMSPKQAMAVGLAHAGLREHMLIPYTRAFQILCLPSTRKGVAKVDPGRGVKIGYIYYWTREFRDPARTREPVPVRYDPFDVSVAFVWLVDHWAECRSEYAAELEGRSEREIAIATQELRARFKRTGERRALNAKLIARYLSDTAATEKTLLQRKRQNEMQAARDLCSDKGMQNIPTAGRSDVEDVWAKVTPKILGDFV